MKKTLILFILTYFKVLAKLQLLKNKPIIIGITGSAGKTSTRNALAAALKNNFKIKVSYKANSETGLPLNILGLKLDNFSWQDWLLMIVRAPIQLFTYWPNHQIYIAEMAIDSPDSPKNMSYLLSIFKPKIGIFLNAQALHSFNFDKLTDISDPEQRTQQLAKLIAHEKGKLITALPKDGLAILNADDQNVLQFQASTQAQVLTFGKSVQAKIKLKNFKPSLDGTSFSFAYLNQELTINFPNFLLPEHVGYSLAATVACCLELKLPIHEIITSLETNFIPPESRSSLLAGINHSYIIDSSYNSSRAPLTDMLHLLKQASPGRKLALLGDMRELGYETQLEHEKLVPVIENCCDVVVLVGPQMKQFVLPLLKKSRTKLKTTWFSTAQEAGEYLRPMMKKDDMLLVKGSQNELFLEMAVEQLMAEPALANKVLCRRGKFWDQKRAQWLAQNNQ